MVKGKETNCQDQSPAEFIECSSYKIKRKLPLHKLRSLPVQEDGREKKHFHACWFALVSLDFHTDNEFYSSVWVFDKFVSVSKLLKLPQSTNR